MGERQTKQTSKRVYNMSDGNKCYGKKKAGWGLERASRGKAAVLYGMSMRIPRERVSKQREQQEQRP